MCLNQTRLVLGFGLVALLCLGLLGCGGGGKKFSKEDFQKVKKDMTEAAVTEILGKPYDSAEMMGNKRLWWKAGDDYYSVSFDKDGKVIAPDGDQEG